MHFGFSVLVTVVAVILVLATGASGNRQAVYVAALLGVIGAIGLPIRGEDGVNIVLCWVFLLASGVAVLLARHKLSPALAGAQAQAPEIEAGANRHLADEYDAAQQRGEINAHGGNRRIKFESPKLENLKPHELHEARVIRDAEKAEPGITRRPHEAVESGEEPTKAKRHRAVNEKRKRRRAGSGSV